MLLCSSVQRRLPSEQSSQRKREKNNGYPLALLRPAFPSPSGQRDGLFPGLVGSRDAQQQIRVLMRSNLDQGREGKKTERYQEYPIPLLFFLKRPFFLVVCPERSFSWSFCYLLPLCISLIGPTFESKPRDNGGKFNPGNLPLCVSSIFNFLLCLSDTVYSSEASRSWFLCPVQRYCL